MSAAACGGPADDGRAAVAEAELAAFGGTDLEAERSMAELAAQAGSVVASRWWSAAGGPPVDVTAARASARSSSARGRDPVAIRLAAGQHDIASLVHELAHALAGVERGHDERFRAALVDVAAVLAGPAAAASMAGALRHLGLSVAARPWPPPVRLEGDRFLVL